MSKLKDQPIDVAKALDKLSLKEMLCFRYVKQKKIVPLETLRDENKSFIGALGRLTRLGLAEVLPLQSNRSVRMVCLLGVIPKENNK